jgi:hypothetical protein
MRATHIKLTACWFGAALALAGCHGHNQLPPEVDEVIKSCEEASQGESFASDESFTKFVEAEAAGRLTREDCRAPALTAPAAGATLDRNVPPTISFTPTQPACAPAAAKTAPAAGKRAGALCRSTPRTRWDRFVRMISPIGVAEAHCPAVDGPNFLVRLRDSKDELVYTALLSVTSFQPKDTVWKRVMSGRGGQTVRLSVTRAVFVRGNIMEGPFVGKEPISLSVAP